jgi:hypothetical protein
VGGSVRLFFLALSFLVGCSSPTGQDEIPMPQPPASFEINLQKGPTGAGGLRLYVLHFTNQPIQVWWGGEEYVLNYSQRVPFGRDVTIRQVCTFVGLVRGDVVEADINIGSMGGPRFYLRSLHKEDLATFDAWDCKAVSVLASGARVSVLGRTTDLNVINGNRFALFHYGIELLVEENPTRAEVAKE